MKKIFKFILTYYWAIRFKVPFFKLDVWYNYSVYNRNALSDVFDENGKYIPINKKKLYVLLELKNGKKAYYKIYNIRTNVGSDWLYASDAYNVDFKLCSIF